MTGVDTEIKTGDACIDLVERGKVVVVDTPYASVGEHQDHEDYDIASYKANALLPVRKAEPVFTVVYLPENPTTSFSGTYDFPRSRLARVPVEEAHQDLRRVQERLVVGVFEALFGAVGDVENVTEWAINDVALQAGIDEALVSEAQELADVEAKFGDGEGDV